MPIQMNYTDPNTGGNATASYWFGTLEHMDRYNSIVVIEYWGYWNQAARSQGKNPIQKYNVIAKFSDLGITGSQTIAQMFAAMDTFALTYQEQNGINNNPPFFQNGTIV